MKVIVEEYQYPVEVVKDILWEGAFQTVDGKVSISYVGYYFNPRKEVNDCVFILPKVLLEDGPGGKDRVFGKYAPESIVNLDASSPLTADERAFVYGFSVWIYRALCVYRKSNPQSGIVYQRESATMGKGRLRKSATLLDILLALLQFQRDNRDFFLFTVKNLHAGFNKINWTRTIATSKAVVDAGSPVYLHPVNKRRMVTDAAGRLSYADDIREADKKATVHSSRQFENRLFDRDTLLVAHYDVNFLFIVALYARNNPSQKAKWKADVRRMFREKIRSMLRERFDLYAMTPRADVDAEQFLRENFQLSLGKVYAPYGNGGAHSYYSLALDRDVKFRDENDAVKGRLAQGFVIAPCPLGTNPATVVAGEAAVATPPVPKRFLTHHWIENYLEKYFLVGCCKDAAHRSWILGRNKFKRLDLYNVRLGRRAGAVVADAALTRSPKFLVLYDFPAPSSYAVYRIRGGMRCGKDKMVQMGYASASCDYYCYALEEKVSLGDLDVPRLLAERKREKGGEFTPGAPLYLKGGELIGFRM